MLIISLFFLSSVADRARDDFNKIILATIYSVLKLLPPEDSFIKLFFTPSTSMILIADPNISVWIRSITAGIHSENIWDFGSLAERYPDPEFLSERASTEEWRATERTWSWYPSDSNWARQSLKQFNQGQCYGWAESFIQRSTSSNLLLHQVTFNLRNDHFMGHYPYTIACSYITWCILLMQTADNRIICFPWGYFSKIRGRAIKRSGSKLDSRILGPG